MRCGAYLAGKYCRSTERSRSYVQDGWLLSTKAPPIPKKTRDVPLPVTDSVNSQGTSSSIIEVAAGSSIWTLLTKVVNALTRMLIQALLEIVVGVEYMFRLWSYFPFPLDWEILFLVTHLIFCGMPSRGLRG